MEWYMPHKAVFGVEACKPGSGIPDAGTWGQEGNWAPSSILLTMIPSLGSRFQKPVEPAQHGTQAKNASSQQVLKPSSSLTDD